MDRPQYEILTKEELLKIIYDYESRFEIIKGIAFFEYGNMSNDDLLGIIHDTVPPHIKPKKLD